MRIPHLAAAALFLLMSACASPPTAPVSAGAAQIDDGRAIAQAQCSGCHAIGPVGASPRPDAPPFRSLFAHYEGAVLQEELIEGIKIGHPDMPNFQLEPGGADALLAYLRSIQE